MNKIVRKIENYLQTEGGQRLLQYGYSFGAAIVIFGAMIKVLHLWGAWGNIIFGVGMGIEVIVFILYGLDRPPKSYKWENVYPVLETEDPADRPQFGQGGYYPHVSSSQHTVQQPTHASQPTPATTPQQSVHTSAEGDTSLNDLSAVSSNVAQFAQATETLTQIANTMQSSYQYLSNNSLDVGVETEKLTRQIQELNQIYARMIQAMTSQQNPQ